ncbi:MAG: O-antigen ligase family protein [Chloroflexota bacterium]
MIHIIRQKIPISNAALLRLAMLAGLVVGLLGVGVLAPIVRPGLILLGVVSPFVVLMALGQLEYGVLAILLTAAFVRFSLPTGTQSRIVMSLVVTAFFIVLWIAQVLVRDERLRLKSLPTSVPLLAFISTTVFSYVWGNAFRDPLVVVWSTWPVVQLGGMAVMVLLPGAFLLTINSICEIRWLKLLCWLMIFIGVLSLAAYLLRIELPFLNTGGLFSLWFVSLTYAQALFNKKLPSWLRLVLLGSVGAWIYIYFIIHITWLSGWLPPLIALGTITFLKSKRLSLIFVLLLAIYVGLNWNYYTSTVLTAEANESGYTRLAAWRQNWQVTGKHLLFGTGPAGYAAYYMSYFPTKAMATHSNYIDILSQTGIVGLFFFLWFFGALGWTGYRLSLRLKGSANFSEGLANATLAGWVGCIVAMGLGDWLFPFVYTQTIAGFDYAVYSWILLGGMLALANMSVPGEVTDA